MPILMIAAAGGLMIGGLDKLLAPSDYPGDALINSKSASALVELIIDPTGDVVNCQMLGFFGDESLAKQVCGIARRKHVSPPQLADGRHVYARVRTNLRFLLPGSRLAEQVLNTTQGAEQIVFVSQINPALTRRPADLLVAVDESGKIVDCVADQFTKNIDVANLACRAKSHFTVDPFILPDGSKSTCISSVRIEFQSNM